MADLNVSQDPGQQPCGSRDGATAPATAALAPTRIDVEGLKAAAEKADWEDRKHTRRTSPRQKAQGPENAFRALASPATILELIAQRSALVEIVDDFRRVNAKAAALGYLQPETWGDEMFALQGRAYAATKPALAPIQARGAE